MNADQYAPGPRQEVCDFKDSGFAGGPGAGFQRPGLVWVRVQYKHISDVSTSKPYMQCKFLEHVPKKKPGIILQQFVIRTFLADNVHCRHTAGSCTKDERDELETALNLEISSLRP